jgi:PadR family transcriptional regulator PadR
LTRLSYIRRVSDVEPLQRITAPTVDVLTALLESDGPVWGLLVVKETERPTGTVYPILERLEERGWIESSWDDDPDHRGPRRRLYAFTPDGRAAAQDLRRSWVRTERPSRAAGATGTARATRIGTVVTP